jgi:hypothetical protein
MSNIDQVKLKAMAAELAKDIKTQTTTTLHLMLEFAVLIVQPSW